jgi:hypothetical protein
MMRRGTFARVAAGSPGMIGRAMSMRNDAAHREPGHAPRLRSPRAVTLVAIIVAAAGCGGTGGERPSGVGSAAGVGAAACGVGTWVLNESAGSCGPCGGISDFVVLTISPDLADAGGTTADSEGNSWQFDRASCTATLTGTCNATDVIDFATDGGPQATCQWTCGSVCPPCQAACNVQPF